MPHTPGPWGWTYDGSSDFSIGPAEDPQSHPVAHVWDRKPDRAAANCHLIAAAPDLLAALQLYEATYVTTQRHPTPGEQAIVMNAVSAAIAKAEGRQPVTS